MMRQILLHVSLAITLGAQSLEQIEAHYNAGDYAQAIDAARTSYEQYDRAELHLIWAKSALALGDKLTAMSAYERVVMCDPKNHEAQLALIALYDALGRSMLSQELRDTLVAQELTPQQRASLLLLDSRYDLSVRLMADLAAGYDSNIGANSDIAVESNGTEAITETLFTRAVAAMNATWFIDDATAWFVGADLRGWVQKNSDADSYDSYDGSAALSLGYRNAWFSLSIPVGYERLYYLERDLMGIIRLAPALNVSFDDIVMQLGAKAEQRRYTNKADRLYDDDVIGGSAALFWYLDDAFAYLKGGYERYSATEALPAYFVDKNIFFASTGYARIVGSWKVRADYNYRNQSYDDRVSQEGQTFERIDHYHDVGVSAGYLFGEEFGLNVSYRYIQNSSEYVSAEYEKQIGMVNLHYGF